MEINCTPPDRDLRNNPAFGFTTGEVEPIFLTPTRELIDFTALVEKSTIRGIRTRGRAEFLHRGRIVEEQRQITRINEHPDR